MSTTIPGGAYLAADGRTWKGANGEPLTKAQRADAEQLLARQQAERADAEQQRLLMEAQRDPAARTIASLMQQAPAERASKS